MNQTIKQTESARSIGKADYYVVMTDTFMSNWGMAAGKLNKFVVGCKTFEQAEQIKRAAAQRSEMQYIKILTAKPYYNRNQHIVSFVEFSTLGEKWTGKVGDETNE